MKRRKFNIPGLLLAAFFVVNIAVSVIYQNNAFVVSEFEVYSEKIQTPVTIAQISDLHEKSFGENNAALFAALRALKPDLIVITGDIIRDSYTDSPNIPYMQTLAKGCAEIAPSFFITGNHDRRHPEMVKKAFADCGVTVLDNRVVSFSKGETAFNIAGIEDQSIDRHGINQIAFPDNGRFNLLLAHKPDPFRTEYVQTGADLVLCGHTHGGQIRLPWGKAILYADGGLFPEYSDGVYREGDTTMVISMGLGASVIPFRLIAPAEITVTRLLQG